MPRLIFVVLRNTLVFQDLMVKYHIPLYTVLDAVGGTVKHVLLRGVAYEAIVLGSLGTLKIPNDPA